MTILPSGTKLGGRQKRLLKNLTITECEPGTLLHDFEAFLSFLRGRGVPATGTLQLPLRVLPEINERMAQPLQLNLKRPQQKSYPHINGLYLLLRASGLVCMGWASKKRGYRSATTSKQKCRSAMRQAGTTWACWSYLAWSRSSAARPNRG